MPFAIKMDPVDERNILSECTFMRNVGAQLSCAPKYVLHNTFGGGRRYLVMEYLEHSVEEYLALCPDERQRDSEIQRLALEMLGAIRELHELDYIHRDIKTANFRVHRGKLYLIDFGIKERYRENGVHIPEAKNSLVIGSLKYASHWTHEGINQSRRDDLEMMGYCLLEILSGRDLWSEIDLHNASGS